MHCDGVLQANNVVCEGTVTIDSWGMIFEGRRGIVRACNHFWLSGLRKRRGGETSKL
jgi:hypothetical protein